MDTSPASNWIDQSPRSNLQRVETDAFGIGVFGVGRFSTTDLTETSWVRIKQAVSIFLLAVLFAVPAAADTFTTDLQLRQPTIGVVDPVTNWGTKYNSNIDIMEAAVCDKRTGCTIVGDLVVTGTVTAADGLIGGATVAVSAPVLGDGSVVDPVALDKSSVTLLGPSPAHSALSGIGSSDHHTQAVNTNADTLCPAGQVLQGSGGGCVTLAGIVGGHAVALASSATSEFFNVSYLATETTVTFKDPHFIIVQDSTDTGHFISISTDFVKGVADLLLGEPNVWIDTNTFTALLDATTISVNLIVATTSVHAGTDVVAQNNVTAQNDITANNDLTAGSTVFAEFVNASSITANLYNIKGTAHNISQGSVGPFSGVKISIGDNQGLFIDNPGVLDEAVFGFAIVSNGEIVGFIATEEEGTEQSFYIGESTDSADGVLRFRGPGAGGFAGDIDIITVDSPGAAIHLNPPNSGGSHVHIQGELFVGGVVGVNDDNHGSANGHADELVCIKSDGRFGRMLQADIPTGTCL